VTNRAKDATACHPTVAAKFGNDVGLDAGLGYVLNNPVMSYVRYQAYMRSMGLTPYGRDAYNKLFEGLEESTSSVLLWQIQCARTFLAKLQSCDEYTRDKKVLIFSIDGCYLNRGHNSDFMTTTMFCTNYRVLTGAVHVVRSQDIDQRWLSYKFEGTATGAESFGTSILTQQLVLDKLFPDVMTLDGDNSLWNEIIRTLHTTKLAPCFNHFTKSAKKSLEATFATKTAFGGLSCHCGKSNHRRVFTNFCGCGINAHAQRLYSMTFGAASQAHDDPDLFTKVVAQFESHMMGIHSGCTFHPQFECDPSICAAPPCDTRGCGCHECTPGRPRQCFGNSTVLEPQCNSTILWKSSLPPITCPRDVAAVKDFVSKMTRSANELLVPGVGKVDTCYNEHTNKVIADTRAKGQHTNSHAYAGMTNVGLLKANQAYFVKMMREWKYGNASVDTIDDEWLWEYHVFKAMATPRTPFQLESIKADIRVRISKADTLKHEKAKVIRVKQKQKRLAVAARRREVNANMTYTGSARSHLTNPLRPMLQVADSGTLVVFDIETPAWGRYHDELMEISAKVMTFRFCDANTSSECEFALTASFTALSRSQSPNAFVVENRLGRNLQLMNKIQHVLTSESALINSFVSFLQANLQHGPAKSSKQQPAYFVAHNGVKCDGQLLELAFQRAGVDSAALFQELHLRGVIDTLMISEMLPWATFTTPASVVTSPTTGAADGGEESDTAVDSDADDAISGLSEDVEDSDNGADSDSDSDSDLEGTSLVEFEPTVDEPELEHVAQERPTGTSADGDSDGDGDGDGDGTTSPQDEFTQPDPPQTPVAHRSSSPSLAQAETTPAHAIPAINPAVSHLVYGESLQRVTEARSAAMARTKARKRRHEEDEDNGEEQAQPEVNSTLRHSQGAIFQRLFGYSPSNAHTAGGDVENLCEIITHPWVWSRVKRSTNFAVHWDQIVRRSNDLHVARLTKVLGWRLQDCPRCDHGPMKPAVVATTAGPCETVKFTCLLGLCREQRNGVRPGWTPPESSTSDPAKAQRSKAGNKPEASAAKASSPKDNGTQGACTCKTVCGSRSYCPCFSSGQMCGALCTHGRTARTRTTTVTKCKNMQPGIAAGLPPTAAPSPQVRKQSKAIKSSTKRRKIVWDTTSSESEAEWDDSEGSRSPALEASSQDDD
jgi:hypothetical protein